MERWENIPRYEGYYQASNMGRVRGIDRITKNVNGATRPLRGRILKGSKHPTSLYSYVVLCKHNVPKTMACHALVLEAFVGPCPDGMECCHSNGVRDDNRLENLRWDTHKANCLDTIKHGKSTRGIKHPMAKLNEMQVSQIKALLQSGLSCYKIAKGFVVCRRTIGQIKTGTTWGWVK